MKRFLTVLDTGAGPNLIRAEELPREFVEKARISKEIVNLRSATSHVLGILEILSLTIKVGDKTARQSFVVARNLVADVILGCNFIDAYVDSIQVRKSRVNLVSGTRLPIQRRPASLPSAELSKENLAILPRSPRTNHVRVSKKITLEPQAETVASVTTGFNGTILIRSRDQLYLQRRIAVTNAVIYVKPDQRFLIKVANFSNTQQSMCKYMILGIALPFPSLIATVKSFPQPEFGLEDNNKPTKEELSLNDADLTHLDPVTHNHVRNLLMEYRRMWDGKLGAVTSTQHRIELPPNAKPFHTSPYRTGPKAHEFEEKEVKRILQDKTMEPAEGKRQRW